MRVFCVIAAVGILGSGVLWWQSSKPTIEQTGAPLSRGDAEQKCPIPLPREAQNIYYAYYSDVTAHQCFVRFEAPYEIGVAHVDIVFRDHAKKMNWSFTSPGSVAIKEPPTLPLDPLPGLRTDWFDIEKIRRGRTFGELKSWQPQIWIDADRNLFFYCLTD